MTEKLSLAAVNYARARQRLIKAIEASLKKDKRFVAAWLTGSYASGQEDAFSDVDISVVVAQEDSEALCSLNLRPVKEQEDLFSRFGEFVNAYQSQQNGPKGSVMTTVFYASGITVDWVLIPEREATRPTPSRLLFDKNRISIESPDAADTDARNIETLKQRTAFFWMMATVTAKSILRREDLRFHVFYEFLLHSAHEIKSLDSGKRPSFVKFSTEDLQLSPEDQANALIAICNKIRKISGNASQPALETIELLLSLTSN